jgi:3',5'-cyclic AMP phosphodiesterase CpdA
MHRPRTLLHLSDLHFGRDARSEDTAAALAAAALAAGIDHVVVTGDVTHWGRVAEFARFRAAFAELERAGVLILVPGNHDRLGDDVAAAMMADDRRVQVRDDEGLYLVRVDSTGPHNRRSVLAGHGRIDEDDIAAVDDALAVAPPGRLVIVAMHHHPLPLPTETMSERLASMLGLPFAAELARGRQLLSCLAGRCDLLLHGHRHVPRHLELPGRPGRPLRLYNAGTSSGMGRARVFSFAADRLLGPPGWLRVDAPVHGDRRPPAPSVETV